MGKGKGEPQAVPGTRLDSLEGVREVSDQRQGGNTQVHTLAEGLQIKGQRSLVAHLNGVQVVAGSNPAGPTK